jgi:hypothetical protein
MGGRRDLHQGNAVVARLTEEDCVDFVTLSGKADIDAILVVLAGEDHITRPGVFEELCPSDRVPFARIGIAATNNPKAETSMRTIGVSHLHPEGSQYHLILLMKIIASIK